MDSSYLRGPLTLPQINALTTTAGKQHLTIKEPEKEKAVGEKPIIPKGMQEYYLRNPRAVAPIRYAAQVLGLAKLHFVDAKNKMMRLQETCLVAPLDESTQAVQWEQAMSLTNLPNQVDQAPLANSLFSDLPGPLMNEKNYAKFEKSLAAYLYQTQELVLYQIKKFDLLSNEGETESEFRSRIAPELRLKRDETIRNLQSKYTDKKGPINAKLIKAQEKMGTKKHKAFWQKLDAFLSAIATVLGALVAEA